MTKAVFPPPAPPSPDLDRSHNAGETSLAHPPLVQVRRIATVSPEARRTLSIGGGALLGSILVAATLFHYLYFLPHPEKATKLFLLDSVFQIAVAALIALSAATIGTRILRLMPRGAMTRLEAGLFAYGLGTGALALVTALIGLLHGYYFPILASELIAPLVIWRRDLALVLRALTPMNQRFALAELTPRTIAESAIFAVILIIGVLIGAHALVPLWGFDVFMYHLALPQRFLALHQLFGSPGLPQANLPFNNEMLNLLALNFQAEIGAALVQTIFVAAMVLAVFALGVRLFSRSIAWLGMAIFLATPLVLFYATSGLIDQHFAFMSLLTIIAMLLYREQHDLRWVIVTGFLIGIGMGVKYQTIYLVGPMLIPFMWWSRPPQPTPAMPSINASDISHEPETAVVAATVPKTREYLAWLRVVVINLLVLSGCALLTFGVWAIREWVQVGNPIYPLIWNGAEWSPARMAYYKSQFDSFGSQQHNRLLHFAVTLFDWFWHWKRYDYAPLPPVPAEALVLLVPVIAFLRWGDARWRRWRQSVLLLLGLCLASLVLWDLFDQLVPRYILPTFGLLALLTACAIEAVVHWLARALTRRGRGVALAAVGTLALIPGLIFGVQTFSGSDPTPIYSGVESYQTYLQTTQMWPSYWLAADYFNHNVPADAKILGVNLAAGYFFKDPYLTPDMNLDMIFYLASVAPTEPQKLAWLRAHGYTYLIYDRHETQWAQGRRDTDNLLKPLVLPFEAFLSHQLVLVRSLDGTDIYLVPPSSSS